MQLTMHHALAKQRIRAFPKRDETVPKLGTEIAIDMNYVSFENQEGKARTPMAKARFDPHTRSWVQVPLSAAGLLLFFQAIPDDNHKIARIKSIIPNGRACYVESE
jgi:hypothetical protein